MPEGKRMHLSSVIAMHNMATEYAHANNLGWPAVDIIINPIKGTAKNQGERSQRRYIGLPHSQSRTPANMQPMAIESAVVSKELPMMLLGYNEGLKCHNPNRTNGTIMTNAPAASRPLRGLSSRRVIGQIT